MNNFFLNTLKKKKQISGQTLVFCALCLAFLLAVVALVQSRNEINERYEELAALELQCEQQLLENEALEDLLNNSDDEYIERKAREELDYVLPGERVYIVRSGN